MASEYLEIAVEATIHQELSGEQPTRRRVTHAFTGVDLHHALQFFASDAAAPADRTAVVTHGTEGALVGTEVVDIHQVILGSERGGLGGCEAGL